MRKAIMKRSQLKNKANKTKNPADMASYKTQRNLVVNMNKKAKESFFRDHDPTKDTKGFWSACKPFFSEQGQDYGRRNILVDNGSIISEDRDVATTFNNYFSNITSSLNIERWNFNSPPFITDPVVAAREKFKFHPSVQAIRSHFFMQETFEFCHVEVQDVSAEISHLDASKKCSGNIPVKILKSVTDAIAPYLTICFNQGLDQQTFPRDLKLADVTPIHKKDATTDKSNFRPVSLLPAISKVFERLICKQILKFMQDKLSKYLCGFRKGYSTQYALFNLILNWQKQLAKKGKIGTVLMDLSKAFDCLPHDLLLAKLQAYGLGYRSLSYIASYLSERKMRVRIGSAFSEWLGVTLGVPQGSILGPILFNIFLNDLFFLDLNSEICNFVDDNTLYACDVSFQGVIEKLTNDIPKVIKWFKANEMVVNPNKFQVMFLGSENPKSYSLNVANYTLESSDTVKLLGVTLDNKLTFNEHLNDLCSKANQKVSALLRIRNSLDQRKASLLSNAYIMSCFNYCPLIWMFCSKTASNQIENTQVRALRAVHTDFATPRDELPEVYQETPLHTRNLRILLIEVYKSLHKINPEFMWNLFTYKETNTSFRRGQLLALPSRQDCYKTSLVLRATLAWNSLPASLKQAESLSAFKTAIEQINSFYCQCKICS